MDSECRLKTLTEVDQLGCVPNCSVYIFHGQVSRAVHEIHGLDQMRIKSFGGNQDGWSQRDLQAQGVTEVCNGPAPDLDAVVV